MNKLSQEVVDIIVRHLVDLLEKKDAKLGKPGQPLAPYSTISYRWKQAVESVLFASVTIKDDNLSKAEEIIGSGGGRWRYVRCLTYKFRAHASGGMPQQGWLSSLNVQDGMIANRPHGRHSLMSLTICTSMIGPQLFDCNLDFMARMIVLIGFINRHWVRREMNTAHTAGTHAESSVF